jgi:hypothetical protein
MTNHHPTTTDRARRQRRSALTHTERPAHTYPEPEQPVVVPDRVVTSTIDTLTRFEEFLRHHASPTVHAELRTYAITQGWHPVSGTEALLDDLGLDAHALYLALTPTTATPMTRPPTPSRDDPATTTCPTCQTPFTPTGRQRYCCTPCRKTAFRRRHQDPPPTVVVVPAAHPTRQITVYECQSCGERLLGEQRCQQCGTFTRRIGIGGPCPHCDEPVALTDLLDLIHQDVTITRSRARTAPTR